jgi:hypothetical protein
MSPEFQHRFEWKYVVKKEYGTMFGLFLGLYAIILVKYYRLYSPSPIPERPLLLAIFPILLFALYGTARWLKKAAAFRPVRDDWAPFPQSRQSLSGLR